MSKDLLKLLINCSDGEFVDLQKFFPQCPDSPKLRNELERLRLMKYISILYAEDEILEIAINPSSRR